MIFPPFVFGLKMFQWGWDASHLYSVCLSLKNECEVELSVHRHMTCSSALPWIVLWSIVQLCVWEAGC
jgi:hypothetical protein